MVYWNIFNSDFFIPKYHYIGSASIYVYVEQRFSLTTRILVTCSFVLVTILSMTVILYGSSLALSQVTGLNIWIEVGLCGIIFIIYTNIADAGGIPKVYETMKANNRLQFSVFDPSIRYIMWSIFISVIFSSTAQYACIQTQAERYMCIKNTRSAKKVAWTNYIMLVSMHILCLCVGCLLYKKYNQCDPLQTKIISRSDQMYPLFIIKTLRRFSGITGLFIACMLNATLSTFSSGANSMATVILEDIYKPLTKNIQC
ncbi:unnamed protein product [Adineta steineri]|uniref:Uncharacterized protein n=1 Tax=Adineta steineri TaxID=433720 RepID=A0A814NS37_9BILA|nr:unnamed protein product [Adineta steineri]CAF3989268.1 unnamed protein product [Adineta steineri]